MYSQLKWQFWKLIICGSKNNPVWLLGTSSEFVCSRQFCVNLQQVLPVSGARVVQGWCRLGVLSTWKQSGEAKGMEA